MVENSKKKNAKVNKKLKLHAGVCAGRWACLNVKSKKCKPLPDKGKNYVECSMFETEIRRRANAKK